MEVQIFVVFTRFMCFDDFRSQEKLTRRPLQQMIFAIFHTVNSYDNTYDVNGNEKKSCRDEHVLVSTIVYCKVFCKYIL